MPVLRRDFHKSNNYDGLVNSLNSELNPICHLLALLGAHHIFHVSGLRVKGLCLQCGDNLYLISDLCCSLASQVWPYFRGALMPQYLFTISILKYFLRKVDDRLHANVR